MVNHAQSHGGSSADASGVVSAAELRRRVRQQERQRTASRVAVADTVRRARARLDRLRAEIADATREESEALAAALRVFGSAADVSEVTGIPSDEIERGAKGVTASRADEVVAGLGARSTGGRQRRRPARSPDAGPVDAATVRGDR